LQANKESGIRVNLKNVLEKKISTTNKYENNSVLSILNMTFALVKSPIKSARATLLS
jgi:hypothetical protein